MPLLQYPTFHRPPGTQQVADPFVGGDAVDDRGGRTPRSCDEWHIAVALDRCHSGRP